MDRKNSFSVILTRTKSLEISIGRTCGASSRPDLSTPVSQCSIHPRHTTYPVHYTCVHTHEQTVWAIPAPTRDQPDIPASIKDSRCPPYQRNSAFCKTDFLLFVVVVSNVRCAYMTCCPERSSFDRGPTLKRFALHLCQNTTAPPTTALFF